MQLGIKKRELVIVFVIFIIMMLTFPLLSEAIEIEQQEEIINEKTEEAKEMGEPEEAVEIEEVEEIEEAVEAEEVEEIEEIMEEEFETEDEEDWEIVIIDEPIPVAVPTFSQTESIDSVEDIVPTTVLPKTGELNSIPQSGLGAIMVWLGVYINRKKMNKF